MTIDDVSKAQKLFMQINKNGDNFIDSNDLDKNKLNLQILKEMGVVDDEGNSTGVKRSLSYIEQNYDKINKSYQRYLLETEGDNLNNDFKDLKGSFDKFRKSNIDKFEDSRKKSNEDFQSFKENENQAVIDFNDNIKKENDDFKKETTFKILNNLKNGYNGFVNLDRIGTITFDKEKNTFILSRNNGQDLTLNDEKLQKIIDIAIKNSVKINGESKKVSYE